MEAIAPRHAPIVAFSLLVSATILLAPRRTVKPKVFTASVARQINSGAATLAFSALVDSALEHFCGGFYNRAMFVAPAVSAATLTSAAIPAHRPDTTSGIQRQIFGSAAFAGIAGFGFLSTIYHGRPGLELG
jgi:hypothetical protein